jgi:ribosomal protein S21
MLLFGPHMAINVEVEKNNSESSANLIRRFTKRIQGSGIIPRMRGLRYYKRTKSRNISKVAKLQKLERKDKYESLLKLGKIQEHQGRGRRR